MLGVIGAGLGLLAGIAARAGARRSCSKRSAPTLPDNGTVIETRTVVVSLLVGIDRHAARRPAAGAARDARAAAGGDARGGRDPAAAARRPAKRS